jgi:hypothetical protein
MIPYSSVTEKHKKLIILCSGPSVSPLVIKFLEKTNIPIIAVNGGIDIYKRCNYWVTIDPSLKNYTRMKRNLEGVKYYCGVPDDYGQSHSKSSAHRKPLLNHVHYLKRGLSSLNGLTENKNSLSTGNSGFAALNLAYHMEAKYVLFLGLDGYGGYSNGISGEPRDLSNMNILFDSVLPQIEKSETKVVNGSTQSIIESFPRVNPLVGLSWIIST